MATLYELFVQCLWAGWKHGFIQGLSFGLLIWCAYRLYRYTVKRLTVIPENHPNIGSPNTEQPMGFRSALNRFKG